MIDLHGHMAPEVLIHAARDRGFMPFPKKPPAALWRRELHLEEMARAGITRRMVSAPPLLYGYELPIDEQARLCRALNLWLAEEAGRTPLVAMGTLPLGDAARALAELRHCVEELGIRSFAIGSHIAGTPLDTAIPDEVWAALAEAGGLVMLHPWKARDGERLKEFRLGNLLGNPFETTVAAARLMNAGILDRHPALEIMLAHGGGALPYLLGRLDRGWEAAREAGERATEAAPSLQARRFWYDTVVFAPEQLRFLVKAVGADRLLLGTDSPFDMGIADPAPLLAASGPGFDGTNGARFVGTKAAA